MACTPSTTTIASSTTIAIASTSAHNVNKFKLNPTRDRMKKVPIRATGMAIVGINVERKSCKKIYTTINTRINASINVFNTSWIEAKRKSLAFMEMFSFNPVGNVFDASSNNASISLMVCVALVPAIWYTIQVTDLCPSTRLVKLYPKRSS